MRRHPLAALLASSAALFGLICANSIRAVLNASPGLPSRGVYAANILGLFVLSGVWLVAAFVASRRDRRPMARRLIAASAAVGMLAALDAYVLTMRFDSSGPGGVLSLTHVNWYRHYVQNNADGFWEDEFDAFRTREKDSTVVAALGDSFTWGQGLPGRELRFSDVLQKSISSHNGRQVRVLNFGQGGTGTVLQNRQIVPVLAKVNPDVVVLFYLFNDLEDVLGLIRVDGLAISSAERWFLAATPLANYWFWQHRASGRMSSLATQMTLAWATNFMDDRSLAAHRDELARMFAAIREMGAKPAAVVLPYPHMWINITPPFRDQIYNRILGTFASLDVPTLSLRELEDRFPPGSFEVNRNDSHPGAAVHAAIAERTKAWLIERGLID
jgi:lysophospholipase L1-like esterase